ncbi:glycosyltransferase [Flavobacterium saliperosum]|uniref:Glycosyl transferase family 2 n=1 Tax=Flavobacterium saliperosum TaxID=329186 RepID=A0A1G4VT35_9FLAO|nr:glycosyltransferase [Flavobacterium saliperosum]SCX11459.1 Glycosyl transferase family 2 [Flavobacterium saliperosum]
MISILIPTYNYNVYPLVTELKKQANSLSIPYEILIQDDASTLFLKENESINSLENCVYALNPENLGRGNNINALNSKAKFGYVLILEADAFPENDNYLEPFIKSISDKTQLVFGGVGYPETKPNSEQLLRWKYGKERESITIEARLKNPYHFVFTWNLLVKKEILSQNPFPVSVKEYGYEDVVFIKKLKTQNVNIQHIENRLIHFNNEESIVFIQKTEKAVRTLKQLLENKELTYEDTRLSKTYSQLRHLGLEKGIAFLFRKLSKRMLSNLTSHNPSLIVLDLYKLGSFCSLDTQKQPTK